jgi:hypothetical protein
MFTECFATNDLACVAIKTHLKENPAIKEFVDDYKKYLVGGGSYQQHRWWKDYSNKSRNLRIIFALQDACTLSFTYRKKYKLGFKFDIETGQFIMARSFKDDEYELIVRSKVLDDNFCNNYKQFINNILEEFDRETDTPKPTWAEVVKRSLVMA